MIYVMVTTLADSFLRNEDPHLYETTKDDIKSRRDVSFFIVDGKELVREVAGLDVNPEDHVVIVGVMKVPNVGAVTQALTSLVPPNRLHLIFIRGAPFVVSPDEDVYVDPRTAIRKLASTVEKLSEGVKAKEEAPPPPMEEEREKPAPVPKEKPAPAPAPVPVPKPPRVIKERVPVIVREGVIVVPGVIYVVGLTTGEVEKLKRAISGKKLTSLVAVGMEGYDIPEGAEPIKVVVTNAHNATALAQMASKVLLVISPTNITDLALPIINDRHVEVILRDFRGSYEVKRRYEPILEQRIHLADPVKTILNAVKSHIKPLPITLERGEL